MTITNYDGIIAARAGGKAEDVMFYKPSLTPAAGAWFSLFRLSGQPPSISPANIPGGSVMNASSTGAIKLTSPGSTDKKYLLTFGVSSSSANLSAVLLVDLLVAAANINANTTSAQTINTTPLSRYTDGKGVMMTMVVTTALGSTASNVTISYTNQDGVSGRSTGAIAMTTSAAVHRLQPAFGCPFIPLQAGDYGVRSVETVTFSAAMGGGVLDLYLFKPLLMIPTIAANTYTERDSTIQIDGLLELVKDSGNEVGCLGLFVLGSGTTAGTITGFIRTCAG